MREGATAPWPDDPPVCSTCGLRQDRFETWYGWWIFLEPVFLHVNLVPVELRWTVDSEERAVNWACADSECQVPHDAVCGRADSPVHVGTEILEIWEMNRRAAAPGA
ncbi:DUF6083 domain-containing protein [Streptoverticillium reticulum]|uniref:DUF6083 domain-containing protein n=1 Tax=Streptoverticillium reticulum TaxID=1433415 RepID=UPI0039BFB040